MPNGRSIYDFITANNLDGICSRLNPLTLRHRQSIVCQTVFDTSLLRYACELGFRDIAKYLLDECEADISEVCPYRCKKKSPLQISVKNLDILMLILLKKRKVVLANACEAQSVFLQAVKNKYFSVASIVTNYMDTIESMDEASKNLNLDKIKSTGKILQHSNVDGIESMDEMSEHSNLNRIESMDEMSEHSNLNRMESMDEMSEHSNLNRMESMDISVHWYLDPIQFMDGMSKHSNLYKWILNGASNISLYLRSSTFGKIERMKNLRKVCILPKATTSCGENALCLTIMHDQNNAEYFLLNYREFSLKEHVLALELAGAKFILFNSNFEKGLELWRKSLRIRTETFFGVSDKFENEHQADLGFEFSCEGELDMLENHDAEIYVQALIVFLRLLPPSNQFLQDAFVIVTQKPIIKKDFLLVITVLAELAELPNISVDYGNFQVDMARSIFSATYFHDCSTTINDLFTKLKQAMHYINGIDWNALLRRRRVFYPYVYRHLLDYVVFKILELNDVYGVSPVGNIWIKDGISQILLCHSDPYPTTLLHLLIENPFSHHMIPFFISCSDDVNCRDNQSNTPMHTAGHLSECDANILYMINLFADAGGHIDTVNKFGITPFMILKSKEIIRNPLKFLSLQCLAAQTIRENNISVPKEYPQILVSFINLHR